MSKARLIITAVTVEGRPVSEVARSYGVARSWIYTLLARYQAEGEAAFEPRSRRPKTSPTAISPETIDLIVRLRKDLAGHGLDAGPDTIAWHLQHQHQVTVSAATIARVPARPHAGRPRAAQATEVVLHPVRRRAAQRVLAVRLHPLSPRRRDRRRGADLAR
jgi:homeodomain-containing protein